LLFKIIPKEMARIIKKIRALKIIMDSGLRLNIFKTGAKR